MSRDEMLGIIGVIIILLVGGFFWFGGETDSKEAEGECLVDSDCVSIQVGCCGCNMGGEERCVLKSEEDYFLKKLENCSTNVLCAAVYNCKAESCGCIEGKCVG